MVELLTAMAATLSDEVVPACEGGPQHAARVVANLCRVLAREAEAGAGNAEQTATDLRDLLGHDTTELPALVEALDSALADGGPLGPELHTLLLANVERRLDVAKPTYR